MKWSSITTAAFVAGTVTLGAGTTMAGDVELFHDKGFWCEALQHLSGH